MSKLFDKKNLPLVIILLLSFILTELIDDLFDHIMGSSILHSIIQLFLFLTLFLVVLKLFEYYQRKNVEKLIPQNLMDILEVVKKSKTKGVKINQSKIMSELNITKPTLKKRLDSLTELNYITYEEKGNNRYIQLTKLGESILN